MHFKVSGKYRLQVVRPDGTVKQEAEFDNLVTDIGLNRMGSASDYLAWCQVGTGSTAPTVTDTALSARVAGSGTTNSSTGGAQPGAPYYAWRIKTFVFSAGSATGNIAEVGVGWDSTGALFSRALVLDSGGSPTTITVLADETLYVTYEFRLYAPTVDTTGQVTFSGNIAGVYDWTMRAANVTTSGSWSIGPNGTDMGSSPSLQAYSGSIGAITTGPAGTSSSGTMTSQSYSSGSLERRMNVSFSLSQGNLGGIRSLLARMGPAQYQIEFSEDGTGNPIPKTSSDTLNLVIAHSWGRA